MRESLRRKVWTWTEILSPNIGYFVGISRFVARYALFRIVWAKQVLFLDKKQMYKEFSSFLMLCTGYALHTVGTVHRVFLENAMVQLINSSVIELSLVCSKKVDAQGALG